MRKREILNFAADAQIRSVLLWKVRQRVHTGTWLAWKCAVLVFNWSRHIWVLESLQSLCICLFWLFFVSDKCVLNPSAHQLKALGWTWRCFWIWGTSAHAMMLLFAGPCSLETWEVVVRSKLRDILWCAWDSCYFTGSWMLMLTRNCTP